MDLQLPILTDHKSTIDDVVGKVCIENGELTAVFEQPIRKEQMIDCSYTVVEHEDGRIKKARIWSLSIKS